MLESSIVQAAEELVEGDPHHTHSTALPAHTNSSQR